MTATPARPGALASAQMVSLWVMEFGAAWLGFLSPECVIVEAIGGQMIDAPVYERAAAGNSLRRETSPYLLQHQDNPVHWWAWGPEALAEAKRTGKPILLSVGYAACHWCHVMAHESFEDEETARVMNELFVNIKVDREERPDVDAIYMAALHELGEQGGWPLTMFLTSDAEPFWGGTYFPREARYGRPAFVQVLKEIARVYRDEQRKVRQNADALKDRLAPKFDESGPDAIPGDAALADLTRRLLQLVDPTHGGMRARRNFRKAGSSISCGAQGSATTCPIRSRRSSSLLPTSRKAASTIISAAASPAIAWTSAGWCRISRRCSTTMRFCSS